ncbi:MAG: acyl-CoA thioesterase [Planctomycetota bacterium]|nr:acyl-CoA thioesterase [Planctomycetota bacterium]
MSEIVFPEDTNPYGTMFGGRALQLMDKVAGVAATRYCHNAVVTACSDRVNFEISIPKGAMIELIGKVVRTGKTSMVVKVSLYDEGLLANQRILCTSGFFTMVAVDKQLRPISVVENFEPQTEKEKADWASAEAAQLRPE